MNHFSSGWKCVALAAAIVFTASGVRAADPSPGHWTSLFNGKDLAGWTVVNGGEFSVTNGVIHLSKGTGWLRTDRPYTNFTFEVEWRALTTNYNSGFLVRAGLEGKPFPADVWQVNLKDTALGGLMRGSKTLVTNFVPPRPAGEWCQFRIQVAGSRMTLAVEGQRTWSFDKMDTSAGYIGLQAENKAFEFRNLRISEIPVTSGR